METTKESKNFNQILLDCPKQPGYAYPEPRYRITISEHFKAIHVSCHDIRLGLSEWMAVSHRKENRY
jgi:hypothetical protein